MPTTSRALLEMASGKSANPQLATHCTPALHATTCLAFIRPGPALAFTTTFEEIDRFPADELESRRGFFWKEAR